MFMKRGKAQTESVDMFAGMDDDDTSTAVAKPSKRVAELEHIIETLDTLFEVGDDCINPVTGEVVLDNEYDALKKELWDLNPNSRIFKSVTSSKSKVRGKKVIHDPPMTSINKCNGTEAEKSTIFIKWIRDAQEPIPIQERPKALDSHLKQNFCMSYKHDGIAVSLEYERGVLKRAGLRSKSGMDGIDVTDKMMFVQGVPQMLAVNETCIIRGELETTYQEYQRQCDILGDNAKANPRAHTAGSLNLKDLDEFKTRGIRFIAYNIIGLEKKYYVTEIQRAAWAQKVLGLNYVKTFPFTWDMLKVMEQNHRKIDFAVDGVVISVNNLTYQQLCGTTGGKKTGNPKGKLAWKFADEKREVVVNKIVWQTGRTGNVTPVLQFDGVQLEGTTVVKCTAHNVGIIRTNKIGIGSRIEVIKSGKIIPKINKVVEAKGRVIVPKDCPSCRGPLNEEEGSDNALALVCTNKDCPAQNIKALNHWLTVLGVKGISESTITKLMEAGFLQKRSDYYKINADDLMNNGFTMRTALLIEARIHMIPEPEQIKDTVPLVDAIKKAVRQKKQIPLDKFFAAFGMDGAGKEVGRILMKQFGDFDKIRKMGEAELLDVDGIGPITAKSIVEFFEANADEINELLKYIELTVPKQGGKLKGTAFVLSGTLDGGKQKWKDAIESAGGEVKGSVGKSVSYLVAGEGSGSKSDKAKKLGIKIINEQELEKLLNG